MSGTGYFAEPLESGRRQTRQAEPGELGVELGAEVGAEGSLGERPADNYLLITHGLLMRIFCMCYLRWTTNEFEQVRHTLTMTVY